MYWSLRLPALVAGCLLAVGACNATSPASPSVSPTATPRASHTPRPTETARPTATARPSQTSTAAPTQTPAPVQTPTRPPSSPPSSPPGGTLAPPGALLFTDDFSGATKYLSTGTAAGYGGGQYTDGIFDLVAEPQFNFLNFSEGETIQSCTGDPCSNPDVVNDHLATATVDVEASLISGSIAGPFGIACRYSGTLGFYALTISADGRHHAISHYYAPVDFPIAVVLGGSIRGDVNPAINQGIGATNHLRADCGQHVLRLSVNGQILATATVETPSGSSTSGIALIAAPGPDGQVDVRFDDLVVSELAQEPPALAVQGVVFGDDLAADVAIWPTGDLESGSAEFTNSAYRLTIPDPSQYQLLFPGTMTPPSDTSTQVDSTFVAGPDASLAGVICRSGPDGYYVFQVAPTGAYSLFRAADSSAYLVDWAQSSAIKTGTGQTNTLRIDCVGDSLTAYVNGTQTAQAADSVLSNGDNGFGAVSAPGEGGTTYDFANFLVSYPAP